MCGYRVAGERAVRIDMLERLADLLRAEDSRGGFEARPDMLSITGTTLEQFADLMQGLGYNGERGERVKVKATPLVETAKPDAPQAADVEVPAPADDVDPTPAAAAPAADMPDIPVEPADIPVAETSGSEPQLQNPDVPDSGEPDSPDAAAPEMEVFYTFTWAQRQHGAGRGKGQPRSGGKPQGKGRPRGKGTAPQGGKRDDSRGRQGTKSFSARPPKPEKKIDPDNPFAAALMGLKDKT
jgi:ATP-dependent RNA helicase SUPV3L1/SUV3